MTTRQLPSENNRILIIDDNPAIHSDFRKILGGSTGAAAALDDVLASVFGEEDSKAAKTHFKIDSAYQGQEGLEKVARSLDEGRPYALAFVDMRMPPGWDGVETITRIWAKDASIQVVICTAYSDYSWREIVSKLGNSDRLVILKKPFDSIEVLQLSHAMTKKWLVTLHAEQKLEDLNQLVLAQNLKLQASNERLTAEMAERELAREELKSSEERLSKAFDACPMPIAILRFHDHACVQINRAFLEATGRSEIEIVGRTPWNAGLCIQTKSLLEMMGKLAMGEPVLRGECSILSADGENRSALVWIEPFELATGQHLLAIVQDVSDQEKLESQLRHAQKVEAIGHLAAGVAHDLNNLLTVVLGHSSIQLAKPNLQADLHEALSEVQDAGQRAAALTRQLLVFSRKQVMQKRNVSLTTVVGNVQAMLRRLIPEDFQLRFECGEELPAIHADVCNVEQIIINLVVNARDAMPRGGAITVRLTQAHIDSERAAQHIDARAGDFVSLSVSDEGEGMDDQTLARIFEPFFTTKEVGKGTGMGLATVFGIVHQHDGWIEVQSRPGGGSTFEVFFPVTQMPDEFEPRISTPEAVCGAKEVVMLVEDDEHVRALARIILQASGYRVLEAEDGPKAISTWRSFEGSIDLLLTDMVMPGGLSGRDVAELFSEDWPEAKVLYSSGYSVDLFGDDLRLKEGLNYLPKPYFAEQLKVAVARARTGSSSRTADVLEVGLRS
jgi:two-component system cell cycle sensor histidine kinase/response regulator CckA